MSKRSLFSILVLMCAFGLFLVGCSDDEDVDGIVNPEINADSRLTCEGCHTSVAALQATVLPDPPPVESESEG